MLQIEEGKTIRLSFRHLKFCINAKDKVNDLKKPVTGRGGFVTFLSFL